MSAKKNKEHRKAIIENRVDLQRNSFDLAKLLDFLIPIGLFIFTYFITSTFARLGSDTTSDGIMMKPALDVSQGLVLFKETFTQYGALVTILQAAAIKIFGPYLMTIRLQTAFFYGLSSVLLWLIWKRFSPKLLVILSIVTWQFLAPYFIWPFVPWSSVYSLFFQLLTIYILILFFEKRKLYWLFMAGMWTALTFWCRQPVGVFLAFFTSITLVYLAILGKFKFRHIFLYYLGGILLSLLFFGYFIINNAMRDWFLQSIAQGFYWNRYYGGSSKLLSTLFTGSFNFISVWIFIPMTTIMVLLLVLFRRYAPKIIVLEENAFTAMLICTFTGLGSWFQYYPINCIRHVYWGSTPMVGVSIFFLWSIATYLARKINGANIWIALTFFAIFWAVFFWKDVSSRFYMGENRLATNTVSIPNPNVFKDVLFTEQESRFYNVISNILNYYLEKHPGKKFITIGSDAMQVTFSDRSENFDPLYINWYWFHSHIYPNHQARLKKYIEENQPLIMKNFIQTENEPKIPEGYCYLQDSTGKDLYMFLVPCLEKASLKGA